MTAFATVAGLAVLGALFAGYVGTEDTVQAMLLVTRWASALSVGGVVLLYAAWRWVPLLQSQIFPYLGGHWEGEVRYQKDPDEEDSELVSKPVKAEAKHTLFAIKLLLESDESLSTTLAVHADKDPDFEKFRLYYVYLNRRKEGVAGSGATYRGLAIVRWEEELSPRLEGDYFTDSLQSRLKLG